MSVMRKYMYVSVTEPGWTTTAECDRLTNSTLSLYFKGKSYFSQVLVLPLYTHTSYILE